MNSLRSGPICYIEEKIPSFLACAILYGRPHGQAHSGLEGFDLRSGTSHTAFRTPSTTSAAHLRVLIASTERQGRSRNIFKLLPTDLPTDPCFQLVHQDSDLIRKVFSSRLITSGRNAVYSTAQLSHRLNPVLDPPPKPVGSAFCPSISFSLPRSVKPGFSSHIPKSF